MTSSNSVRLVFFEQSIGCDSCTPTRRALENIAAEDGRVTLQTLNLVLDTQQAAEYGVDLERTFGLAGAYLPSDDKPNYGYRGPEASRRARAFPVWATLRAYGRAGHRELVERNLALARRLGKSVEQAPDLELLAEVKLNIICFRYRPEGADEGSLDELNSRLGDAVLEDGRVYAGTTVYGGRVAFRPAIVNWRTREQDIDFFVDVVRELGSGLRRG